MFNFMESLAVPIFFCITGYFLQCKLSKPVCRDKVYKARLFKYIILYCKLSLAYLPLTIYGITYYNQNNSAIHNLANLIINYLIIGEQYYSWPLWYLLSLIWSLFVLKALPRMSTRRLLVASFIIFAFAYCANTLSDTYLVTHTIRSGRIFTGISYLMLGMIVYRHKTIFGSVKGLVIILVAALLSCVLHLDYSTTNIMAFISAPWIVGFAMNFTMIESEVSISKLVRDMSAWIYYSHMYFLFFIVHFRKGYFSDTSTFAFVTLSSFIISLFICILKRRMY